jgi:MFS family permease
MPVKEPNVKELPLVRNKQFWSIFCIAFLIYFSNNMLAQTLPKYAYDLGASAQLIGVLAGAFAVCALMLRPVSGQLVDNENRLLLLRVTIGIILLSVTGLVFSKQVGLLILFRGINGLGWGIGSTLCMTIASGCFTKKNLGSGIGIYGLGQTIAQATAPMIGLNVSASYGYNFLYQFNVIICAVAFFLTYFVVIDSKRHQLHKYSLKLNAMIAPQAVPPAMMTMANAIAQSSITAFLVIYATRLQIAQIGIYFTVQAATVLCTRPLWGKLTDKYGSFRIILPCEMLIALGLFAIYQATELWQFLLAAILVGSGTAGDQPALMSECIRGVPSEERGRASNTNFLGIDLGWFIGGNFAGFVVSLVGYRDLYLIFILPIILATIFYVWMKKRQDKIRTNSLECSK